MATSSSKKSIAKEKPAKAAKGDTKLVRDFLDILTQQAPPQDLKGWGGEDLQTVARIMCETAHQRKSGAQKVRVFTPDLKRDRWHMPYTVVAIVNDDMPFIIDSVASEIAFEGHHIDTLFHPIVCVQREKGVLKHVAGRTADTGHMVESFVFIRLEKFKNENNSINNF